MEGVGVRVAVRAAGVGILVLVTAVLLAMGSSIISVTAVAATTALIMGGTGDPLSTPKDTLAFIQQYTGMAVDQYITPSSTTTPATGIPTGPYNAVAVITPAEWAPQTGTLTLDQSVALGRQNLDNCIKATDCVYNTDLGSAAPAASDTFVVFGYSQGAMVATLEKRSLAAEFPDGAGPNVSFEMIGNGNRPNGGFLARGPEGFTIPSGLIFGGATFNGSTPTDTQYKTVDIAGQYDAWADVPLNPFNLVAVANWYSSYVHYNYKNVSLSDHGIINQGQYGDTTYYMIPTKILPLLAPVTQVPVIGTALADALDAPLRVLVEAAYDRTISPGQPTPWNPLYMPNPVKLAINLVASIPVGLDNAFEDTMGIRPFGTVRPGPYGVGGPAVTETDPPATTAAAESTTTREEATKKAATLKAGASKTTASESKTAEDASSAADSSALEAETAAGENAEKASEVASKEDSTLEDSTAVTEPTQPTTEPKPAETTGVKDVTTTKPGTVATDAPAADGATTQSPTGAKQSDEVKHQPRHALSGSAASSPNSITKRISEMAKEAQSAATSASAGDDSGSQHLGPRHAR